MLKNKLLDLSDFCSLLGSELTCGDIPLVQGPVLGAGHELEVIQGPGDAGDLALVPLQHVQGLERDGVVHVDGVLHNFEK